MLNAQPITLPFAPVEVVARNTIFSSPFLQTIKILINIWNNALFSGILGEKFNIEIIVSQRRSESPKAP